MLAIWALLLFSFVSAASDSEVILPTKCEVCRLLVHEFLLRLNETHSSDSIKLGTQGDSFRKIKYDRSELRFIEVLHDPHICQRMLNYKLHKERQGCSRFDKTIPETQKSLNDLVKRGVEVKLDVPLELWDKPSVEVTSLHKQCIPMVSKFEEDLEEWFYKYQDEVELLTYLCRDRVLKGMQQDCLDENFQPQDKMSEHTDL